MTSTSPCKAAVDDSSRWREELPIGQDCNLACQVDKRRVTWKEREQQFWSLTFSLMWLSNDRADSLVGPISQSLPHNHDGSLDR